MTAIYWSAAALYYFGFQPEYGRAIRTAAVAALPGVPVWAIDADGIIVRPGPRLVDGVEALAAILHPDAVPAPPPGTIAAVPGEAVI